MTYVQPGRLNGERWGLSLGTGEGDGGGVGGRLNHTLCSLFAVWRSVRKGLPLDTLTFILPVDIKISDKVELIRSKQEEGFHDREEEEEEDTLLVM